MYRETDLNFYNSIYIYKEPSLRCDSIQHIRTPAAVVFANRDPPKSARSFISKKIPSGLPLPHT